MGRRMSRKLSRTVLSGGKGGDNIKTLPITINPGIEREAGDAVKPPD